MRKWQGMNWIRQEKRLAIYMRDDHRCVYCASTSSLTLDHVVTVHAGGSNHESNLVTACVTCNSSRGKKTVRQFAPEALPRIKALTRKSITNLREEAKRLLAAN